MSIELNMDTDIDTDSLLLSDYMPSDLGLDERMFPKYRRVQLEAMEEVVYGRGSERRFVGLGLPTGSGKSVLAVSLYKLMGMRTVICTSTKGLMDQYREKFKHAGLVDVRGKANYTCVEDSGQDCKTGARLGCPCPCVRGTYGEARDRSKTSALVSTNYDYWLAVNKYGQGVQRSVKEQGLSGPNPVEMLILDEADLAVGKLSSFMHVRVNEREVERTHDVEQVGDELTQWRKVASVIAVEIGKELETFAMEWELMKAQGMAKEMAALDERVEKLEESKSKFESIVEMVDGEWVVEKHVHARYGVHWTLDVLWPGRYAERYLFCGVPKVVLMSATLRPRHMRQLGIKEDESTFREWRRVFQPSRGPIVHLPPVKVVQTSEGPREVMVNLNHNIKPSDLDLWVGLMDEWMDEWLVRGRYKGLIHTVAYHRQAYILEHSRHRRRMLANTQDPESESAWEVFDRHCKSADPCVLVSPSFGTGWDFEGDRARWQLISKVPFMPRTGKLVQARLKIDAMYADQKTMDDLMQACGRINRSDEDWGVTGIVDGALSFFMTRNKGLAASWFGQAIRRVREVPEARSLAGRKGGRE